MKYSLGLDIGTASVGWAVINEDKQRIEDLGVRIFERPENPKNGESLAKPRRDARSARRRLRRRRQRLDGLKNFFVNQQLLTSEQIQFLLTPNRANHSKYDPYLLRQKAIDSQVSNEELFLAIYHIAKRRGYKSNRKKVEEKETESGKVLQAINQNKALLANYRSVATALLQDDKFKLNKRNKLDSYTNSFIREDFEKELIAILKTQNWSDSWIQELLYSTPNGLFFQRPFMTPELIEKMRGKCPLESEPRAPKNSFSFELFRLAQDLSHLTYNDGNKLSPEQIQQVVKKAKTTAKVTYKAVKEVIGFKNDTNFHFDYIRGKQAGYSEMEKREFCNLKFYHAIKKACTETDWSAVEQDIDVFDQIGYVLTACKDDVSVKDALTKLQLSSTTIDQLEKLSFSGFCGHSLTALRKLTPHLLNGQTYNQAVESEYPGKFNEQLSGDKNELPPLSEDQLNQLTNPVVKRSISQTRKVVNAVIRKYGAPTQIKIECANELAKNFKDRRDIKKAQDENAELNTKIIQNLKELGVTNPSGTQITKYKLREQQLCKCAYCGKNLDEDTLLDDRLTEIDHIIPFSRSGNDGLNNKVIVCPTCNQDKLNRTPFEKWGNDPARWSKIQELAESFNIPFAKKKRILAEKIPKEEWASHALNDTRYIMRFISQYIKSNLKFSDESKGKQKVVLPTGFITSYLRKMYHLGDKDRELNNCHHAVDACIIASVNQAQIKKFAEYNKWKELGAKYHTAIWYDENGEPHQKTKVEYEAMKEELLPWERFDEEVRKRSGATYDSGKIEKLSDFRDKFRDFASYDADFLNQIHPLFVSRMPKRSTKGQAHKETIRSPKFKDGGRRLTRKKLSDCTLVDIQNSVLPESDKMLYDQLCELYARNGKDAFKKPIYKNNQSVDKNGKPIAPVRTIKVYSTEPSGILVNHNTQFVNNGSTVCLNIYKRNNKFFCAPVYVHALKNQVEILPTPLGRSAAEKADLQKLYTKDGKIFATPENGFELVMSVFPNDYIRLVYENKTVEGYYVKYGITGGTLSLINHNDASKKDDTIIRCSVGKAVAIYKLNISVLGDNYTER